LARAKQRDLEIGASATLLADGERSAEGGILILPVFEILDRLYGFFFPLIVDQREGGCIAKFPMQGVRPMRFDVTRKLLSAASNEDALRVFDWCARTPRYRQK
jgi:hypothetical protein